MTVPLLAVEDLSVEYRSRRAWFRGGERDVRALDAVSMTLQEGASLGIVGESGSGKSTLARAVLRLQKPSSGRIWWRGTRLDSASGARLHAIRREMQAVFQDPFGSLDPRMTAAQSMAEALESLEGLRDRRRLEERTGKALDDVGLGPEIGGRYPHQLSGGQCQRVAIARAIIAGPRLLICDEATSALDVSVQAQIINLLLELRRQTGVGLLIISHDLAVVRHLCEEIVVLKQGRVLERASRSVLFESPQHPYTRGLIDAVLAPGGVY